MKRPTREEYDNFVCDIVIKWKWLHPTSLVQYIVESIYKKYLSDTDNEQNQEIESE